MLKPKQLTKTNRFTRSIFWELRDLIPFGNHPVYRYLLGWLGAPKVSFLKLTMTPQIRKEVVYKHVVQDIIIPVDEMARAIDLFHEWFNIYPLLVFPIAIFDRRPHQGYLRAPKNLFTRKGPGVAGRGYTEGQCEMYFDLGAYGVPQKVRCYLIYILYEYKVATARESVQVFVFVSSLLVLSAVGIARQLQHLSRPL
jgi:Delta24-sterol reductase